MVNAELYEKCYCGLCSEDPSNIGFKQSMTVCLGKTKEALLHHRWQEAAEYMVSYSQMIEERRNIPNLSYKLVGIYIHCDEKLLTI